MVYCGVHSFLFSLSVSRLFKKNKKSFGFLVPFAGVQIREWKQHYALIFFNKLECDIFRVFSDFFKASGSLWECIIAQFCAYLLTRMPHTFNGGYTQEILHIIDAWVKKYLMIFTTIIFKQTKNSNILFAPFFTKANKIKDWKRQFKTPHAYTLRSILLSKIDCRFPINLFANPLWKTDGLKTA